MSMVGGHRPWGLGRLNRTSINAELWGASLGTCHWSVIFPGPAAAGSARDPSGIVATELGPDVARPPLAASTRLRRLKAILMGVILFVARGWRRGWLKKDARRAD